MIFLIFEFRKENRKFQKKIIVFSDFLLFDK